MIKYSSDGEVIWLKTIKSDHNCSVSGISSDTEGYIYISGYFSEEFTFDETTTLSEGNNIFVLKLNNSGNLEWTKTFNGDFRAESLILKTDLQNNLFLAGSFSSFLTLDSVTFKGDYFSDIFLISLSKEGRSLKSFHFSGDGNDYINDLIVQDRNVYCVGSFESNITLFDTTLTSNGQSDVFFMNFDLDTNQVLVRHIGGKYEDYGKRISLDNDTNIIIGGSHSGEISLSHDIALQSSGRLDSYICKYNNNGDLIWADNIGGSSNEFLTDLVLTQNDEVYLTGNYRGKIKKQDFEIESNTFSHDVFYAKYDKNGNLELLQSIGDTTPELGKSILKKDVANLIISANLFNSVDILNNKLDSVIGNDFLIANLYDCSHGSLIELPKDTTLCESDYTIIADSNFNEYYWNTLKGQNIYKADSSGLYILSVLDNNGCISSDSINIILNKPIQVYIGEDVVSEIGDTITLSTNATFKTYLWNTQSKSESVKILTSWMSEGDYWYKVIVSDSNNCQSFDEILLTLVDVSDQNPNNLKLQIFPNPVKHILNFSLTNIDVTNDVKLSLVAQSGIRIWNNEVVAKNEKYVDIIDVSSFKPGVYILYVTNGDSSGKQVITVLQ